MAIRYDIDLNTILIIAAVGIGILILWYAGDQIAAWWANVWNGNNTPESAGSNPAVAPTLFDSTDQEQQTLQDALQGIITPPALGNQ